MAGAMIWMVTAVPAAMRMSPAGHAAVSAGLAAILLAML
jgi:hypothetical protein